MAKISLRNYNRFIENLIENGQHDEAIAHCRHILQTFPKYIEIYRLLGKAYLESKRYTEAVDIFQRMLMSVPDDFVSHVGLSIIADDQSKLDEAIWHMERAFETQPSNAAIQGELQRLFGRRDGVEPPKIRLTRGALAHMYVQGELYTQAVSEIRAVLANDPQRIDMQMLLAKAYFRMGQKADASGSCSQLLKRYPYCLDALRILVELLPGTQNPESTQGYLQRVIELDPYAAFAQDSLFHSDQVADAAVNLEQLEYNGQAVDMGANWGASSGIELTPDATLISSAQPAWLKQSTPAPAPEPEPTPVSQSEEQIPDFLRQAGWGESSGEPQVSQPAVAEEAESTEAVQADLPDWIKAMAPAAIDIPAATLDSSPVPPAMETPDWLQKLDKSQPAASAPSAEIPQPAPSSQDLPDWLQSLDHSHTAAPSPLPQATINQPKPAPASSPKPEITSPKPAPAIQTQRLDVDQTVGTDSPSAETLGADRLGELGKSTQEQDDAMAWLESLAAKHGAKAEELVTDPNARTDVAPVWVDKAKTIGEMPAAVTPAPAVEQPSVESDDETAMWLRNLKDSEAETFVTKNDEKEPSTVAESPDWMSGLSDQNTFSQLSNETREAGEDAPIFGAQETPDWLKDMQHEPAQPTSQDVPDWLRGMEQPAQPVEPAAPSEVSSSNPPVDLPGWLAGLDKEESTTSFAGPADADLPAWLANEHEVAPPVAEPTQPEEWHPVEIEPQAAEAAQPADWSVTAEPSAQAKVPSREVSFKVEQPQPAKPSAPKMQRSSKPIRKPEIGASLENAQSEMGRGNIGAAIEVYAKLIRKGKSLEEIIRDLRDALYRYPVEVPLWQALGDAYMRSNLLQEALDAYTKAEELLR